MLGLCVYTLITILPNGSKYREYPMIEGVLVKEISNDVSLVDFTKSLKKLKANLYWNTQVIKVRSNECIFNRSTP